MDAPLSIGLVSRPSRAIISSATPNCQMTIWQPSPANDGEVALPELQKFHRNLRNHVPQSVHNVNLPLAYRARSSFASSS